MFQPQTGSFGYLAFDDSEQGKEASAGFQPQTGSFGYLAYQAAKSLLQFLISFNPKRVPSAI